MLIDREIQNTLDELCLNEPNCIATNSRVEPGQRIRVNGSSEFSKSRLWMIKWVAQNRLNQGDVAVKVLQEDGSVAETVLGLGTLEDYFPLATTNGQNYLICPVPYQLTQ